MPGVYGGMRDLVQEIVERRADQKTLVEESPKKSSGSNGVVERILQLLTGVCRAILLHSQSRLDISVDCKERIAAFILEYEAYLVNCLVLVKRG